MKCQRLLGSSAHFHGRSSRGRSPIILRGSPCVTVYVKPETGEELFSPSPTAAGGPARCRRWKCFDFALPVVFDAEWQAENTVLQGSELYPRTSPGHRIMFSGHTGLQNHEGRLLFALIFSPSRSQKRDRHLNKRADFLETPELVGMILQLLVCGTCWRPDTNCLRPVTSVN